MKSNASAYYHWPPVWVGSQPEQVGINIDVSTIASEVYRESLPIGISVRVLQEGVFIFDFEDWPPGRIIEEDKDTPADFDVVGEAILRRVSVMNTHLACLYTAIANEQNNAPTKLMIVTPSEVLAMKSLTSDPEMSMSDSRIAELASSRFPSTYCDGLPTGFDWRLKDRHLVIETNAVERSVRMLTDIFKHPDPRTPLHVDLYIRGCKAYTDHDYNLSLSTTWTLIEALLQQLWERYIESKDREETVDGQPAKFMNRTRRDTLTGRDYSASVIVEILSLADCIPFPLYKQLSEVRGIRNRWIHGLVTVSRPKALLSLEVAKQVLKIVDNLDLNVPLPSSFHY